MNPNDKRDALIAAQEKELKRLRGAVLCFAGSVARNGYGGIVFQWAANRIVSECHGKPHAEFDWIREGQ